MNETNVYSPIYPVKYEDRGTCFYCGCESEFEDFAPPKRYFQYYYRSGDDASFASIPCCKECHGFLKTCPAGLIDERKTHINRYIEKKYRLALNVYEKWDEDELEEIGKSLAESIVAGIPLGEETYNRLRYPGFEYEINDTVFHARRQNTKLFTVRGETFDNFRNALQYTSRSYRININVLKEWLMKYDSIFDDALTAYFNHIEEEQVLKHKKKLCKEFAKEHKRNVNFITGALDAYEQANSDLTLEQCLKLLYEERIK